MNHWLIKSEPSKWSWGQQVKAKTTHWDGVRNFQAAANLKAMRVGDVAFFYHSNEGKEIVGLVEVVRAAYPDPTDDTGKFVMVDVRARTPLTKPVTLAIIKAHPQLKDMALVRQSRLSVCPVSAAEARTILKLSGV